MIHPLPSAEAFSLVAIFAITDALSPTQSLVADARLRLPAP